MEVVEESKVDVVEEEQERENNRAKAAAALDSEQFARIVDSQQADAEERSLKARSISLAKILASEEQLVRELEQKRDDIVLLAERRIAQLRTEIDEEDERARKILDEKDLEAKSELQRQSGQVTAVISSEMERERRELEEKQRDAKESSSKLRSLIETSAAFEEEKNRRLAEMQADESIETSARRASAEVARFLGAEADQELQKVPLEKTLVDTGSGSAFNQEEIDRKLSDVNRNESGSLATLLSNSQAMALRLEEMEEEMRQLAERSYQLTLVKAQSEAEQDRRQREEKFLNQVNKIEQETQAALAALEMDFEQRRRTEESKIAGEENQMVRQENLKFIHQQLSSEKTQQKEQQEDVEKSLENKNSHEESQSKKTVQKGGNCICF